MASRPMLQQLGRAIEEKGGEEWVFNQLADGVSPAARESQHDLWKEAARDS